MARIPARLFIFTILFASPAMAQSSWLHPSDKEYQYIIDAAFHQAKTGRSDAQVLEFIGNLADGANSYVSVRPPLACADLHAQKRRDEIERAPTVGEVKKVCDGQLLVAARHFFAPLDLDRSLVVEHGESEIKPSHSFYDHAHPIVAIDPSAGGEEVAYAYLDLHVVAPDAAWDDDVKFVTAGVNGEQTVLTFNFSSQVENERRIDSASR